MCSNLFRNVSLFSLAFFVSKLCKSLHFSLNCLVRQKVVHKNMIYPLRKSSLYLHLPSSVLDFVNVPSSHSLKVLHKMVVEQGGAFSMNLNISVTHCVAAESKGIKYQAAKLWGDVIHYSWVLDCCIQKKLLQLQPKYFLFLSGTSKKKLQEELDEFSDSYYVDVDFGDIKSLLSSLEKVESSRVDYYKGKYCPKRRWSILKDCRIYFHCSTLSLNLKWVMLLELAMKRLKLETSMGGGKVSDSILYATHLVVLSIPGIKEDFSTLLRSFSAADQPLLRRRRLNVVGSQWLEDSLEREHKLGEDIYSLRPKSLEESDAEDCQNLIFEAPNLDVKQRTSSSSSPSKAVHQGGKAAVSDTQKMSTSSKTNSKRKRGRPSGKSAMLERKATVNQTRRIRGRHGNKAAKVYENVPDRSPSEVDEMKNHEGEGFSEITGPETGIYFEMHENQIEGSLEPSQRTLKEQKPIVEETDYGERLERGCELNFPGRSKCDESEKQTLVDPIQAMLLDMIPSLGNNKTETTKDPALAHEQPQSENNLEPVKKRKVSYKDTVDYLLKDW